MVLGAINIGDVYHGVEELNTMGEGGGGGRNAGHSVREYVAMSYCCL